MEFSKEFREALSQFSPKEKDKLIVRLLKKDKILAQKLYFELIETISVDEKRDQLQQNIQKKIEQYAQTIQNPKYLLLLLRKLSAEITMHVKVTSDKFGEVFLNLILVKTVLEQYESKLKKLRFERYYKLYIYLINKIFRVLILTLKLDRDYYLEIDEVLRDTLFALKNDQKMQDLCDENELNFSYFETENIPENLPERVKELKFRGLLK